MPSASTTNLNRRRVLQVGAAGLVVVGGGAFAGTRLLGGPAGVGPGAATVGRAEAARRAGGTVIRKDTINVLPMETLAVDLQADNPGEWLIHCHNIYHGELGMMTVLSYVS